MSYDQYSSDCQSRSKTRRAPIVTGLVIAGLIALYGWMGKRDSDPQLAVMTYDCAPPIEMSMPIDTGREKL